MTDRNPAEIMYPNHQSDPTSGSWHIELRYLPIAHRGHAFLALVDDRRPDGKADPGPRFNGRISKIATVASGSRDQIEKTWARGMRTGAAINAEKFDYKAHDPAYEFGGAGGQIQNSNSVAFTLGKAMGLDLSSALRDAGMTRIFSGWDRDLLDPKYQRYVAPPMFPVTNAP